MDKCLMREPICILEKVTFSYPTLVWVLVSEVK